MIKVRAKVPSGKFGFYPPCRRYNGDEFEVESKDNLGSWMEVVGEEPPKKRRKAKTETQPEEPVNSEES